MNSHHKPTAFPSTTGSTARLHVLGATAQTIPVEVRILVREGNTLVIQSACPLPAGAPLKIEVAGGLVLGESGPAAARAGGWIVPVAIDQVIPSVSELASLMSNLLAAGAGREPREGPAMHIRASSSARVG